MFQISTNPPTLFIWRPRKKWTDMKSLYLLIQTTSHYGTGLLWNSLRIRLSSKHKTRMFFEEPAVVDPGCRSTRASKEKEKTLSCIISASDFDCENSFIWINFVWTDSGLCWYLQWHDSMLHCSMSKSVVVQCLNLSDFKASMSKLEHDSNIQRSVPES